MKSNLKSAHHLGGDIHCVSMAIRRALDIFISTQVSPELTGTRGLVLGFISRRTAEGKAVYQRDIEDHFRISPPSVTGLLKAMEQDGFIVRTSAAQDARLKSLSLTEKGRACDQALRACIDAFECELRKGLDDTQLDQLKGILALLFQNANALQMGADGNNALRKES